SVVQYFPSIGYLFKVLQQAARVTSPGGHIFIGDIRNLSLLPAYHASVQLYKASSETRAEDLWRKIAKAQRSEEELALDPALFSEIADRWPRVGRAWIDLKSGDYDNELSRFRYDVTLEIGAKQEIENPNRWLGWSQDGSWEPKLRHIFRENSAAAVGLRGI